MSDFSQMCDAIVADLTANVPGLTGLQPSRIHLYAPWTPDELEATVGERHLAVWPVAEAETVGTLTTNAYMLEQTFLVLVWEGVPEESARGRLDTAGAAALLELHNAVRARFLSAANFQLAGADSVRPVASSLPEVSSPVRWFALRIAVSRVKDWTP